MLFVGRHNVHKLAVNAWIQLLESVFRSKRMPKDIRDNRTDYGAGGRNGRLAATGGQQDDDLSILSIVPLVFAD